MELLAGYLLGVMANDSIGGLLDADLIMSDSDSCFFDGETWD